MPEENAYRLFRAEKAVQYARAFAVTFETPLAPFYTYPFGFEIVRFDEWLEVPDGISTKQFIQQHYGEDAVKMIEDLLNIE